MLTAVLILCAFLLVLANGFFVLAEFAMVKVRATRIEELALAGDRRAKAADRILRRVEAYLPATQLGITLSSLGLGWLGEPAFAEAFKFLFESAGLRHAAAVGVSGVLGFGWITFMHILIGELAPKAMAIRKPEAAALASAIPLTVFYWIFVIPLWILMHSSNLILRVIGIPPARGAEAVHSEEELRLVLARSQAAGVMTFNRLLLVENAFDLGELTVRDVMVPIERAAVVDLSKPRAEIVALVRQRRLTRYPLVEKAGGEITGFIHLKDLALAAMDAAGPADLAKLRRPVARVREDVLLETALREMQRRRVQFSLVENAKGKPVGLVTFEDILEEIVGDIEDEFEVESPIRIGQMVQSGTILLDPDVPDARGLIDRMLEAAKGTVPGLNVDEVRATIWKREEAMPTALGDGIAIPHARVAGLEKPVVAIARIRAGVEFGPPGTPPTHLFALVLTPPAPAGLQVRILGRIAETLGSQFLRTRLLDARTPLECMEILTIGDADTHV